jgi:hypothetical protein
VPRRGDEAQPRLQLQIAIDWGVSEAGEIPQGGVEPRIVAGHVEMLAPHERSDPGGGEGIVAAAMVEIVMGRDQQIDVAGGDTKLGQALHHVVLRLGVVEEIPPRRGRGLPDHCGRVAGVDQDDASRRGADQVAGNLGEVHLACVRVT